MSSGLDRPNGSGRCLARRVLAFIASGVMALGSVAASASAENTADGDHHPSRVCVTFAAMRAVFADELGRPVANTRSAFERCGADWQAALREMLGDYPQHTEEQRRNREVLETLLDEPPDTTNAPPSN